VTSWPNDADSDTSELRPEFLQTPGQGVRRLWPFRAENDVNTRARLLEVSGSFGHPSSSFLLLRFFTVRPKRAGDFAAASASFFASASASSASRSGLLTMVSSSRSRTVVVPVHSPLSYMNSSNASATGSSDKTSAPAVAEDSANAVAKVPSGQKAVSQAVTNLAKVAIRGRSSLSRSS
jgi:hypothetical protein